MDDSDRNDEGWTITASTKAMADTKDSDSGQDKKIHSFAGGTPEISAIWVASGVSEAVGDFLRTSGEVENNDKIRTDRSDIESTLIEMKNHDAQEVNKITEEYIEFATSKHGYEISQPTKEDLLKMSETDNPEAGDAIKEIISEFLSDTFHQVSFQGLCGESKRRALHPFVGGVKRNYENYCGNSRSQPVLRTQSKKVLRFKSETEVFIIPSYDDEYECEGGIGTGSGYSADSSGLKSLDREEGLTLKLMRLKGEDEEERIDELDSENDEEETVEMKRTEFSDALGDTVENYVETRVIGEAIKILSECGRHDLFNIGESHVESVAPSECGDQEYLASSDPAIFESILDSENNLVSNVGGYVDSVLLPESATLAVGDSEVSVDKPSRLSLDIEEYLESELLPELAIVAVEENLGLSAEDLPVLVCDIKEFVETELMPESVAEAIKNDRAAEADEMEVTEPKSEAQDLATSIMDFVICCSIEESNNKLISDESAPPCVETQAEELCVETQAEELCEAQGIDDPADDSCVEIFDDQEYIVHDCDVVFEEFEKSENNSPRGSQSPNYLEENFEEDEDISQLIKISEFRSRTRSRYHPPKVMDNETPSYSVQSIITDDHTFASFVEEISPEEEIKPQIGLDVLKLVEAAEICHANMFSGENQAIPEKLEQIESGLAQLQSLVSGIESSLRADLLRGYETVETQLPVEELNKNELPFETASVSETVEEIEPCELESPEFNEHNKPENSQLLCEETIQMPESPELQNIEECGTEIAEESAELDLLQNENLEISQTSDSPAKLGEIVPEFQCDAEVRSWSQMSSDNEEVRNDNELFEKIIESVVTLQMANAWASNESNSETTPEIFQEQEKHLEISDEARQAPPEKPPRIMLYPNNYRFEEEDQRFKFQPHESLESLVNNQSHWPEESFSARSNIPDKLDDILDPEFGEDSEECLIEIPYLNTTEISTDDDNQAPVLSESPENLASILGENELVEDLCEDPDFDDAEDTDTEPFSDLEGETEVDQEMEMIEKLSNEYYLSESADPQGLPPIPKLKSLREKSFFISDISLERSNYETEVASYKSHPYKCNNSYWNTNIPDDLSIRRPANSNISLDVHVGDQAEAEDDFNEFEQGLLTESEILQIEQISAETRNQNFKELSNLLAEKSGCRRTNSYERFQSIGEQTYNSRLQNFKDHQDERDDFYNESADDESTELSNLTAADLGLTVTPIKFDDSDEDDPQIELDPEDVAEIEDDGEENLNAMVGKLSDSSFYQMYEACTDGRKLNFVQVPAESCPRSLAADPEFGDLDLEYRPSRTESVDSIDDEVNIDELDPFNEQKSCGLYGAEKPKLDLEESAEDFDGPENMPDDTPPVDEPFDEFLAKALEEVMDEARAKVRKEAGEEVQQFFQKIQNAKEEISEDAEDEGADAEDKHLAEESAKIQGKDVENSSPQNQVSRTVLIPDDVFGMKYCLLDATDSTIQPKKSFSFKYYTKGDLEKLSPPSTGRQGARIPKQAWANGRFDAKDHFGVRDSSGICVSKRIVRSTINGLKLKRTNPTTNFSLEESEDAHENLPSSNGDNIGRDSSSKQTTANRTNKIVCGVSAREYQANNATRKRTIQEVGLENPASISSLAGLPNSSKEIIENKVGGSDMNQAESGLPDRKSTEQVPEKKSIWKFWNYLGFSKRNKVGSELLTMNRNCTASPSKSETKLTTSTSERATNSERRTKRAKFSLPSDSLLKEVQQGIR